MWTQLYTFVLSVGTWDAFSVPFESTWSRKNTFCHQWGSNQKIIQYNLQTPPVFRSLSNWGSRSILNPKISRQVLSNKLPYKNVHRHLVSYRCTNGNGKKSYLRVSLINIYRHQSVWCRVWILSRLFKRNPPNGLSTSFPRSSILPPPRASKERPGLSSLSPGGGKMRDPGNEVDGLWVVSHEYRFENMYELERDYFR